MIDLSGSDDNDSRIRRLRAVEALIDYKFWDFKEPDLNEGYGVNADDYIESLRDHKGCLEVEWKKAPQAGMTDVIKTVWEYLGEYEVEHTFGND